MPDTLKVGDHVEIQNGPFVATWEVDELIDVGARLRYLGDVRFVGFEHPTAAPNGDALTTDTEHAFIGGAHFHSAKVVSER